MSVRLVYVLPRQLMSLFAKVTQAALLRSHWLVGFASIGQPLSLLGSGPLQNIDVEARTP